MIFFEHMLQSELIGRFINDLLFQSLVYTSAIVILLIVSVTDIRSRRIPNKIIVPALSIAILWPLTQNNPSSYWWGGLIGLIVLLIPVLIYGHEKAGMGDVKLALFIGLIVGVGNILGVLIIAYTSAFLAGLLLILLKKAKWKSGIPFGPFLALGAILQIGVSVVNI